MYHQITKQVIQEEYHTKNMIIIVQQIWMNKSLNNLCTNTKKIETLNNKEGA